MRDHVSEMLHRQAMRDRSRIRTERVTRSAQKPLLCPKCRRTLVPVRKRVKCVPCNDSGQGLIFRRCLFCGGTGTVESATLSGPVPVVARRITAGSSPSGHHRSVNWATCV